MDQEHCQIAGISSMVDDFHFFFDFFNVTVPEQRHRLPFVLPETSKGGTEDLSSYCFPPFSGTDAPT